MHDGNTAGLWSLWSSTCARVTTFCLSDLSSNSKEHLGYKSLGAVIAKTGLVFKAVTTNAATGAKVFANPHKMLSNRSRQLTRTTTLLGALQSHARNGAAAQFDAATLQ